MLKQVPTPSLRLWSLRSAWRDPPRQRSWNKRARREVRLVRALYTLTHFVCAAEREKGDKIRRLDLLSRTQHRRHVRRRISSSIYVHLIWFPVKGMIDIKFGFLYYKSFVIWWCHRAIAQQSGVDWPRWWISDLRILPLLSQFAHFSFFLLPFYTYWMNFVWSMPTVGAGQ